MAVVTDSTYIVVEIGRSKMNNSKITTLGLCIVFAIGINAQILPSEGCAVKYAYDDAGNRTDRYWHCWTNVAEAVKSGLQETSIKAYPNPSNGQLTVEIEGHEKGGLLELLTPDGKVQKSIENPLVITAWDLSDLSNGIYWIRYIYKEEMLISMISLTQ